MQVYYYEMSVEYNLIEFQRDLENKLQAGCLFLFKGKFERSRIGIRFFISALCPKIIFILNS